MADIANRYPENVTGSYYVDNQCIDCDLCRETAPASFKRNDFGIGYYLSHPLSIFQIWSGGIHIFGAFLFGGVAIWLYAKIRKLPLLIFLDGVSLGLPLAQAIGRWGNFINQELYGPPTTLPWGLRIDSLHRIPPYNNLSLYPESVRFHPLFLYESLWNFLGFCLIFGFLAAFSPS